MPAGSANTMGGMFADCAMASTIGINAVAIAVVPTNNRCMYWMMNINTINITRMEDPASPSALKMVTANHLAAPVFIKISPSEMPPPAMRMICHDIP